MGKRYSKYLLMLILAVLTETAQKEWAAVLIVQIK